MKVKSKKTILEYSFQIEEYYGKYGVLYLLNVNNILNDLKTIILLVSFCPNAEAQDKYLIISNTIRSN